MLPSIPAYVYYIKHKTLGYYYWGSRTANIRHNRMPEDDFWKFYFTSSNTIENLINEYGADFWTTEIVYCNVDIDVVYWYEQDSIKKDIKDPLCLNKKYQDRASGNTIFSTAGKIPWNKGIEQVATKGDKNPAKRPEVREKIRSKATGKKFSDNHRQNLSLSHIDGKLSGKTYEEIHGEEKAKELRAMRSKSGKGKKRSAETIKNNSDAQTGKRWITNGIIAKPLYPGEIMPDGFKYGRLPCSEESKRKNQESQLKRIKQLK
jgi:hypothetical protein